MIIVKFAQITEIISVIYSNFTIFAKKIINKNDGAFN
jgi:hypothetical protein